MTFVEFWPTIESLIIPHFIGMFSGMIFGILICMFLFSKHYIGLMITWNKWVKISPFLIITLFGGIFEILKIIELASETQPIYHMWAYLLGSSMIVVAYGMITGFGCGGIIGGIFVNNYGEEIK